MTFMTSLMDRIAGHIPASPGGNAGAATAAGQELAPDFEGIMALIRQQVQPATAQNAGQGAALPGVGVLPGMAEAMPVASAEGVMPEGDSVELSVKDEDGVADPEAAPTTDVQVTPQPVAVAMPVAPIVVPTPTTETAAVQTAAQVDGIQARNETTRGVITVRWASQEQGETAQAASAAPNSPPNALALLRAAMKMPVADAPATAAMAAPAMTGTDFLTLAMQQGGGKAIPKAIQSALPNESQMVGATLSPDLSAALAMRDAVKAAGLDIDAAADTGTDNTLAALTMPDMSAATTAAATSMPVTISLPDAAQINATAGMSQGIDVGATLSDKVIDVAVDGQWIDRLAQEISQISAGDGPTRFHLKPEHLGSVNVEILRREDGGTDVRMVVDNDSARAALEQGRAQLQQDARLSALRLDEVRIERDTTAAGSGASNDWGGQNNPDQTPKAPLIESVLVNGEPSGSERDMTPSVDIRARYA